VNNPCRASETVSILTLFPKTSCIQFRSADRDQGSLHRWKVLLDNGNVLESVIGLSGFSSGGISVADVSFSNLAGWAGERGNGFVTAE
jgi:hypothetical protein